ncbi:MAG: toxin-antitoxin system YwqK family antitoxin [Muribaculaceae bacterium]
MKKLIFTFICIAMNFVVMAQEKVHKVEEVSVINYGDGRLLFREMNDDKTPLNGQHRIIDGYRSEYILAEFKDGMFNGVYQQFRNGNLIETGTYKDGRWNGEHKKYFSDGKTLQRLVNFRDGKADGISTTYGQNSKIETEKGFKNGVEDGYDRRYDLETGKVTMDTYYKDGKKAGRWTEQISGNRTGFTRVSNYANGMLNGEYSETFSTGKIRKKGSYLGGKKNGVWIINRDNGTPDRSTTYINDEKNGEEKIFYTSGKIEKSYNYRNGKKHGLCRDYNFETGKIKAEYNFENGLREGKYKYFYAEGVLREEGIYKNDSEVSRIEYYNSGKLKSSTKRDSNGQVETTRYDD